jgi:hypothetical protein
MEWAEESLVNVHQAIQANDVRSESNHQTHACLILAEMVLNVCHKEIHLFVNAHKDFLDNAAKTKCKQTHVNQIRVKTEAFV